MGTVGGFWAVVGGLLAVLVSVLVLLSNETLSADRGWSNSIPESDIPLDENLPVPVGESLFLTLDSILSSELVFTMGTWACRR